MKTKTTLLLAIGLFMAHLGNSQTVWEDFDNPANADYFFINGTAFDEMYANPDMAGENTSALCGSYTRNGAVQYDVIVFDPNNTNIVDDVTDYVSGDKTMSIKLYSPAAGIPIQITLENSNSAGPTNYPTGRHSEYLVTTTASDAWETFTFSFFQQPDPTVANTEVNRLVLLFDPGSFSSATFVWDDLMGPEFIDPCEGVVPEPSTLDDFECQRHINYTFSNGNLSTQMNPNSSGINTSSDVGFFQKWPPPTNDGAFGGSLNTSFTTAEYNVMQFQLYSPDAPQEFLVIFQDGSLNELFNVSITTSNSTDWENFELDLSAIPSDVIIENIVMLLDPSTDTEDSIYLDNLSLSFFTSVANSQDPPSTQFVVYPMPFSNELKVASEIRIEEMIIIDLLGNEIFRQSDVKTMSVIIDTSDFEHGAYVVMIADTEGHTYSKKVIK
jgi:hypothetical protein